MILIVGGAHQGKWKTALGLLAENRPGCAEASEALAACPETLAADGRRDELEAAMERPVVYMLHEYLRRFSSEADAEAKMQAFIGRLAAENPDAIVVCNELGCGVVPMEKEDRVWRELTGDACQLLAEKSEAVYRVSCGIPQRIKGGKT